jgi:hypothetical protein
MLVGYVSDERYTALPDALLEFVSAAGSWEARSRASGAVHVDLPDGEFDVTIYKSGYGAKRVRMTPRVGQPYQFRLLSDGLLGYAWPKWVQSAEKSEFRVHAIEPYKLELWRYGITKELVRHLGWHDDHAPRATMQITPDGDYTQTGVQWNKFGYTNPADRHFVEAPERSGLYYFHARDEGGREFSFPWIVAPSRPSAPIAVLASNITWNAYNNFGGRSNYVHADRMPETPTVNSRLELKRYLEPEHIVWCADEYAPLSFDRPEPLNHIPFDEQAADPIEGRSACHLAPAEWRLLAWLEREGFQYDLYAETQLHSGVLNLDAYQVVVLNCHPEYWTLNMYQHVLRWVQERGGRLMYLGGNGLNCAVDLPSDDTMIVRNGRIRSLWAEGIGAESRMAKIGQSEAALLGVVFDPRGIMTAAPYRVVAADHWCFAGTGLKAGELFGLQSLHMRCPGGASGHETDKISTSSPVNVLVLAKGTNPDEGGAEMIIYDTPSGGQAFSVGSISYPACLLVDDHVSRVTFNVLKRFLE